MPLPLSRSQIERLGKRLIAEDKPTLKDVDQLNELLLAYREVLSEAVERVEVATGLRPSSRIKTRGTTIDKLRRGRGSSLKMMQDLAGMRLVVGPTRTEQDEIVTRVVEEFADGRKTPLVIDRRAEPSHGYRAVHVVVYPADAQLEIQVRTRLQHEWAEVFEKLADRVGREIRYGERAGAWASELVGDEHHDLVFAFARANGLVSQMDMLSAYADALERDPGLSERHRAWHLARFDEQLDQVRTDIAALKLSSWHR